MVTCLFPRKGEENMEILNTYLVTLERDIFKVRIIVRWKIWKYHKVSIYKFMTQLIMHLLNIF